WHGPVGDAAAPPVRRPDRALASPTGALLPPRLRTAAGDFGAGLGAVGAGAGRGQLRGHDLVHDRLVGRDREAVVRQVDRTLLRAGDGGDVDLHSSPPADA